MLWALISHRSHNKKSNFYVPTYNLKKQKKQKKYKGKRKETYTMMKAQSDNTKFVPQ